MGINTLGIASVATIIVVCYLVGLMVKLIPVTCGLTGAIVGLVWYFGKWSDYSASDPITAVAVDIVSGLDATGIHQVYQQMFKGG